MGPHDGGWVPIPNTERSFSHVSKNLKSRVASGGSMNDRVSNYLRYYDLERYLFEDVRSAFHRDGDLSAFDFFSIVIWKANRAKSKIAKRLMTRGDDLDSVVRELASELHNAPTGRDRLRILMQEYGFLLPMATAILTVLWPDEFTVYDIRVCDSLDRFHELGNLTRFDRIWAGYSIFVDGVRDAAPPDLSLRDKDRYLWAKSAMGQLEQNLEFWSRNQADA